MKSILLGLCLFGCANTQLKADGLINLSSAQLSEMSVQQSPMLIDIRTEQEWKKSGVIRDSHLLQFFDNQGDFDMSEWLSNVQKIRSSNDQPVVLICRSGNRSKKVGDVLTRQLGMKNIYHLQGGVNAWQQSGHKLVTVCESNVPC